MKKLAFALGILSLSSYTFAQLPLPILPTEVSVPSLPGGFIIGGSAFYLDPSVNNGGLDYATIATGTTSPFHSQVKSFDSNYDWGWGVNLGFIFPQTGNDVAINYWQLDKVKNSRTLHSDNNGINSAIFPIFFADPVGLTTGVTTLGNQITATTEFDFDQIGLSFGQYINVGSRMHLHPFAGVQYSRIDQTINSSLTGFVGFLDALIPFLTTNYSKSDFDGIGPHIGIDGTYDLGSGFGIAGHFNSALLISDIDSSLTAATATPAAMTPGLVGVLPSTFQNTFSSPSTHRIVPNLQAKLGANYTFVFNNEGTTYVTLEAGYQIDEYFNALDYLRSTNTLNLAVNTELLSLFFAQTTGPLQHRTANYCMQGPYANLTFYF